MPIPPHEASLRQIYPGEAISIPAPEAGAQLYLGNQARVDAAGDPPEFQLTPAITLTLKPGQLIYQIWTQGRMTESGQTQIKPSLAAGNETRSHAKQILDALKEAILRLVSEDEVQITIHGRAVTFKDPAKVQEMLDKYQTIVDQQENRGVITSIPVRFR